MYRLTVLALFVTSSTALWGVVGRTQSVAVQGRLICNGQPAGDVKLKLYDDNIMLDQKLAESHSNYDGTFRIAGSTREITDIDPKLNIYHRCNYGGACYKKLKIYIPHQYISDGSIPQRVFDIGTLNLANQFSGQTTDCINK